MNSYDKIKKCEELLGKPEKVEKNLEKISENKNFLLFKAKIKDNLIKKLKNEIPIIIYVILQNSIFHHFEKIFNNNYFEKRK